MRNNYVLLTLLLLPIICSCSRNKKSSGNESSPLYISIKESDFDKKYKFYDIIDDVEFLPLELTDESVIGKVDKIRFYKNYILILDNKSQSIFIFDTKGKYINKISRVGSGPYEYDEINDFCVHPRTGEISIAARSSKVLTFNFDLTKCTLYDEILPSIGYVVAIEQFENGNYVFALNNQEANVCITDSTMNVLYKGKPNPFQNTNISYNNKTFSRYGDTILCRLPTCYNDTIYRVVSNSVIPWSAPDFEIHIDYSTLNDCFIDTPPYGIQFCNNKMSVSTTFPYLETNTLVSYLVTYNQKYNSNLFSVLYSKKNKHVKVLTSSNVTDRPVNFIAYFGGIAVQSERFVQVASAVTISNFQIQKEDDPICLRLKELKKQVDEDSNPVLMFVKYKD